MNIADITTRPPIFPVASQSKIPWDDPEFSARMLKEHLDQSHDWASRQQQAVAAHVHLLTSRLGPGSKHVLDLGCGPGLYTRELAQLGHACLGVDFSPAAIAYAQQEATRQKLAARYELRDIRTFTPQREFHCVLLCFGELNVFSRDEAANLLATCRQALVPGGFWLWKRTLSRPCVRPGLRPQAGRRRQADFFPTAPTSAFANTPGTRPRAAPPAAIILLTRKTAKPGNMPLSCRLTKKRN